VGASSSTGRVEHTRTKSPWCCCRQADRQGGSWVLKTRTHDARVLRVCTLKHPACRCSSGEVCLTAQSHRHGDAMVLADRRRHSPCGHARNTVPSVRTHLWQVALHSCAGQHRVEHLARAPPEQVAVLDDGQVQVPVGRGRGASSNTSVRSCGGTAGMQADDSSHQLWCHVVLSGCQVIQSNNTLHTIPFTPWAGVHQ
jgi:hypothetical protein